VGKLLLRWLIDAIAVWAAIYLIPGIAVVNGWVTVFIVALILGLVNALINPIIRLLTCPLILLTLGLFTLIINALMLMLVGFIAEFLGLGFVVAGFIPALLGSVVISVVSFVLSVLTGADADRRRRRRR
jgi:putative membrane protein